MRPWPRRSERLLTVSTLSDPTLGLLTEIGVANFSRSQLETMLMRANLEQYAPPGFAANKRDLLLRHLREAKAEVLRGTEAAHRALLDFVLEIVKRIGPDIPAVRQNLDELYEALLADGYQMALSDTGLFTLLPTEPSAVPLARETTALEAELAARGYTTVLNHYRQAVDGLVNHKYESANGDLRTTLEDLVTRLAEDHTGYQRQPRANQGAAAINHLIHGGHLPERDGGQLLRGLWQMTHTNGPHPGQSDADEARLRMQIITATARFLLRYFRAGP
jgi:hypothetical protein